MAGSLTPGWKAVKVTSVIHEEGGERTSNPPKPTTSPHKIPDKKYSLFLHGGL